jgi:methylmalonyl-CoA/ethylmalonyl-CoA epimerase
MVIDHIGVVVSSLEEGMKQWQNLFGYARNSDVVTNVLQKVRVVFLSKPGSITVKLVEPVDRTSPVYDVARRGGGLHHLCFRCEDLKTQVSDLQASGMRMIVSPQPGEAFNGADIAFLLSKGNLNIELIDTTEKAGWSHDIDGSVIVSSASL